MVAPTFDVNLTLSGTVTPRQAPADVFDPAAAFGAGFGWDDIQKIADIVRSLRDVAGSPDFDRLVAAIRELIASARR